MSARPLCALVPLVLLPTAPAQPGSGDLSARVRPVTAEIRDAGILHLGTGTWTRPGGTSASALLAGPHVVYSNTCDSGGYFGAMVQGEAWTDEGSLPDPGMPSTPATSAPGDFDTSPGCEYAYSINGFQIAYCTSSPTFACEIRFHDAYQVPGTFLECGAGIGAPPVATFPLSSLPGSTSAAQACWIIAIDLTTMSPDGSFVLSGTGTQPRSFGWTFAMTSPAPALTDGPLIAGNFQDCSGTDGTRWDVGTGSVAWPNNLGEPGTGMQTMDAFRIDGATSAPGGPGCYFFGGDPLASFHLELYSDVACSSSAVGTVACEPGVAGVLACPCGNAPAGPGRGCNNSANTGGARLVMTSPNGASVSNDTVVATATNELPFRTTLFLQGDGLIAGGVLSGDGVRCAGGQLLRLNGLSTAASNGQGTATYPNALSPQGIAARSAALGAPILPGDVRHYQALYRDANPTFCPSPQGDTWNATSAVTLTWGP